MKVTKKKCGCNGVGRVLGMNTLIPLINLSCCIAEALPSPRSDCCTSNFVGTYYVECKILNDYKKI